MATMTKAKQAEQERREAKQQLRELIAAGDTVYTMLRHVSRSGMLRHIDLYVIEDGEPRCISWWAAKAMRDPVTESGAIKVPGCGMDMGYHLVYNLGRTLFPASFDCVGEGCPSNDHSNGDRDYTPHRHSDGGYALRHRWL